MNYYQLSLFLSVILCPCGSGKSAEMFVTLYEWFWSDNIWLPVNLTWADLEDKEGRVYAKASHLYVTVPCAFMFLLVRFLFERYNLYVALQCYSAIHICSFFLNTQTQILLCWSHSSRPVLSRHRYVTYSRICNGCHGQG